jgi:hypothetical protein
LSHRKAEQKHSQGVATVKRSARSAETDAALLTVPAFFVAEDKGYTAIAMAAGLPLLVIATQRENLAGFRDWK